MDDNWITFLHDHPKYYDGFMSDLDATERKALNLLVDAEGPDLLRAQATVRFVKEFRARIHNTIATPLQPKEVTV